MLEKVRAEWVEARKLRDEVKSNLLGAVVAEVNRIAKDDGQRPATDGDCVVMLKKFLKNLEETIVDLEKVGRDAGKEKKEAAILVSFIPSQMDAETLRVKIQEIIGALGEVGNVKAIGKVMAELKAKYNGQYDGKLASDVAKKCLTGAGD